MCHCFETVCVHIHVVDILIRGSVDTFLDLMLYFFLELCLCLLHAGLHVVFHGGHVIEGLIHKEFQLIGTVAGYLIITICYL